MKTFDEALEAISGFATSGEVAQFLNERSIKGEKGNSRTCPIAEYLEVETGLTVSVDTNNVSSWADEIIRTEPLPGSVSIFIDSFDKGFYHELER